ncbi:MAG TPA: IclR family transcriptional regulator C-terminal domain-containing protein, partial [Amaricoccus sp.]|nr:IclR family transcriptional regulator C-terminal domain-containing protein [Amaricoccus sp.]
RLSVVDGDNLVWVAVAQGATAGLRYDPGQEQGVVVHLASTSAGIAWLSTMDDDAVVTRVSLQGLGRASGEAGEGAPRTLAAVRERVEAARRAGYAVAVDSYIPGMGAMALPVRYRGSEPVLGALSIAGPAVRMTPARMAALGPVLAAAAEELGTIAGGSQYFQNMVRDCAGAPVPAEAAAQ